MITAYLVGALMGVIAGVLMTIVSAVLDDPRCAEIGLGIIIIGIGWPVALVVLFIRGIFIAVRGY